MENYTVYEDGTIKYARTIASNIRIYRDFTIIDMKEHIRELSLVLAEAEDKQEEYLNGKV
jgi:hypothetical protein